MLPLLTFDYDKQEFTSLGINFSVNLNLIPETNYPKTIEKVRGVLNKLENRCLTPFGKISLIKNNILSKFVHVFSPLLSLKCYLDEINNITCICGIKKQN